MRRNLIYRYAAVIILRTAGIYQNNFNINFTVKIPIIVKLDYNQICFTKIFCNFLYNFCNFFIMDIFISKFV